MGDDRRDVIEILTHDHREVEEMFDELTAATDADERRRITDDVTIELIRHSIAEEVHLYPAVRRVVPDGDQLADKEISDHAEVERVLKELEQADPAHESFDTLINRLIEDVSAHVEEEEGILFPSSPSMRKPTSCWNWATRSSPPSVWRPLGRTPRRPTRRR